jgi:hypothetical protein
VDETSESHETSETLSQGSTVVAEEAVKDKSQIKKRKASEKSETVIENEAQARKEERWRSEEYAVTVRRMNHILAHLDVKFEDLVVDAFANQWNHRVRVWFGPGGIVEDAMTANWKGIGLMWMNPPYSKLAEIIDKIDRERARCVLVVPAWTTEPWWTKLQQMIYKKYWYRVGTSIFELNGREVEGVKWPVVACVVDHELAAKKRAKEEESLMPVGRAVTRSEMAEEWRCTPSYRRRERRRAQEEDRKKVPRRK